MSLAACNWACRRSWRQPEDQISGLKTQVTGTNARMDQLVLCGKKGLLYAPGQAGADGQGCLPIVPTCTYQYTSMELGKDGRYPANYGVSDFNKCIAAAPDKSWQVVGYDVCHEDGHYCSTDGFCALFQRHLQVVSNLSTRGRWQRAASRRREVSTKGC
ncbi:hypothetical protein AJ88_19855 [Mesorhizobium amorphae CCBAU 01583]|nr:hypothetical protein AJ88_19855 [Mesorhizobium amorphae CCBAU 01583]